MASLLVVTCSWITIIVSLIYKIPQIVSVLRAWSVEGLSLQSLLLELTGFSINLAYNVSSGYPLDSYAEYMLLVPQDVLLLLLMLHMTSRLSVAWLSSLAAAGGVMTSVALGKAPPAVASLLISLALPMGWSSKVVQLKQILQSKDARSISMTTWLLAALTCATRIITTLAETGDPTLLTCFTVNFGLNILVVLAAFCYRDGPADKLKKAQ